MTRQGPLEIVVATNNLGKVREIQELLGNLKVKLRFLSDFPQVKQVEEVGSTYEENAVIKALGYFGQTGLPCLADDSGLECDALGGMPGVRSARFSEDASSAQEKSEKLLQALGQIPVGQRGARFVCCMALVASGALDLASESDKHSIHVVRGECEGEIALVARGKNGFGYDPIFIPAGYRATFAELPIEIKNTISHRAKALLEMRAFLNHWIDKLDRLPPGS